MKLDNAFAKIDEAEIVALSAPQSAEAKSETVITPIPASAIPIERALADLDRTAPAAVWKYHDADGKLLFGVARWNDQRKEKELSPDLLGTHRRRQ